MDEKKNNGEPGKTGDRFTDLLWEVYQYPRTHPEAEGPIKNRECVAWKYRSVTGQGFDEFGLALFTLQTLALQAVLRKAIRECSENGEARRLFGEILALLENSFKDREIQVSGDDDIDNLMDEIDDRLYYAREAIEKELYDDYGFIALDMLQAYSTCLREGIFCERLIDYSK